MRSSLALRRKMNRKPTISAAVLRIMAIVVDKLHKTLRAIDQASKLNASNGRPVLGNIIGIVNRPAILSPSTSWKS